MIHYFTIFLAVYGWVIIFGTVSFIVSGKGEAVLLAILQLGCLLTSGVFSTVAFVRAWRELRKKD